MGEDVGTDVHGEDASAMEDDSRDFELQGEICGPGEEGIGDEAVGFEVVDEVL